MALENSMDQSPTTSSNTPEQVQDTSQQKSVDDPRPQETQEPSDVPAMDATSDSSEPKNEPGKMFVGGLSWQTDDDGLKTYFGKFGSVKTAVVMKDDGTNRSRGFGFVTFVDAESVGRVSAHGSHTLDGKSIDPKIAIPRKQPVTKTKKIFVGGISSDTTSEDLRTFFANECGDRGKVEEAMVMEDRQNGRHRGFGFVLFDNEDVVDVIVEKRYYDLNGKTVETKKAQPREAMHPSSRHRPTRPYGGFANVYHSQWLQAMAYQPMRGGRGGRNTRQTIPMGPLPMINPQAMDRMRQGMPLYYDPFAFMPLLRPTNPNAAAAGHDRSATFNPYPAFNTAGSSRFQAPLSPTGPPPQTTADASTSAHSTSVASMNQGAHGYGGYAGASNQGASANQLVSGMGQMSLNPAQTISSSAYDTSTPAYSMGTSFGPGVNHQRY